MSSSDSLFDVMLDWITDPATVGLIQRALAGSVVLDTWMNGEQEEAVADEAQVLLSHAVEEFTARAMSSGAIFPYQQMPEGYVRSVFQELLASIALYQAQTRKGFREVNDSIAQRAVAILERFVQSEQCGLSAAGAFYFLISAHEDLNAIHYYQRMKREDFLFGTHHRPWSDMLLTNQLDIYLTAGLLKTVFTGDGNMLALTDRGTEVLQHLCKLLEEAGKFEWRANSQRWVIFNETDYDGIFRRVFPDGHRTTWEYIQSLEIPPGAQVLEIGAGTGRATLELGLAERVAQACGTLVALEPSAALINVLRKKCLKGTAPNIQIVRGYAEDLPFPDDSFDVVVAVTVLHFTELKQAVQEMTRVAKPGGLITAATATEFTVLDNPMVSMWFRPLKTLADELGLPFGEKQGVPPGLVEAEMRESGLDNILVMPSGSRMWATDHRSFLEFFLKGAAFYQNILSRLPYQERWRIIRLLDETGAQIAATTTAKEQEMFIPAELVYARKP